MPPKSKSKPTAQALQQNTRSGTARGSLIADQLDESDASDDYHGGLSEEGRVIFAMLMKKLDTIVDELRIKSNRLDLAEQENAALRAKVLKLEDRVDNLETRDRCSNLILSGKALSTLNDGNMIQSTTVFLNQKMQYELNSEKIASAFRLGPKSSTQSADTRKLMIRFRDKGGPG